MVDLIEANGVAPCYIRPIALRGYGEIGVSPMSSPVEVYIANFPWGKYVAGHGGADVCISSWNRLAPNTMPSLAKAGANYMNSQLIRMEAEINGYAEGIALDVNGISQRGLRRKHLPGAQWRALHPAVGQLRALRHHPQIGADHRPALGFPVVEQPLPREMLYIGDEVFFTGTAAEVTHLRSVDKILVGDGTMGRSPRRSTTILRHRQRHQARPLRTGSPRSKSPWPSRSELKRRPVLFKNTDVRKNCRVPLPFTVFS